VDVSRERLAVAERAHTELDGIRYVHADLSTGRRGYPPRAV
jgi:hypothetical protein